VTVRSPPQRQLARRLRQQGAPGGADGRCGSSCCLAGYTTLSSVAKRLTLPKVAGSCQSRWLSGGRRLNHVDGREPKSGTTSATDRANIDLRGETMRTILGACLLAAAFVVPAIADNAPKKGSDADEAFMTGIRKIGVMSGQAFACSSEADQPQVGQAAIDLATQVSLHFGLQAAFIYSGSFGYGIGHDFDHKTCSQALEDFKALQAKYLAH